MIAADYWPEPLRRYVDTATGHLRFRRRMSFLAWVFHATFGAGALVGVWVAISSTAERAAGVGLFLTCGGVVALVLASMLLDRVEVTRQSDAWLIERSIGSWRLRHTEVRDADIMAVFVVSARTWPDFEESYSLSIEFPLRPFSGAPAPIVLLAGFEVPKLDLAILAKLMEEEAKAARAHEQPSSADPHAGNQQ
jgi:hypothetical protein